MGSGSRRRSVCGAPGGSGLAFPAGGGAGISPAAWEPERQQIEKKKNPGAVNAPGLAGYSLRNFQQLKQDSDGKNQNAE